MRPRRVISEETRRTLLARKGALTALSQHPSWVEMEAEVERKATRIEKIVIARTLGATGAIDERELMYLRGFVHGMRWLVTVPTTAEVSLERFLKEQQGLHVAEEEAS